MRAGDRIRGRANGRTDVRNPLREQMFNLGDVARTEPPQFAQLALCVAPELIARDRAVDLVLKDSGNSSDYAERGLAFDQRALAQDCFQPERRGFRALIPSEPR